MIPQELSIKLKLLNEMVENLVKEKQISDVKILQLENQLETQNKRFTVLEEEWIKWKKKNKQKKEKKILLEKEKLNFKNEMKISFHHPDITSIKRSDKTVITKTGKGCSNASACSNLIPISLQKVFGCKISLINLPNEWLCVGFHQKNGFISFLFFFFFFKFCFQKTG